MSLTGLQSELIKSNSCVSSIVPHRHKESESLGVKEKLDWLRNRQEQDPNATAYITLYVIYV